MIADRARFGFFHVKYDENHLGRGAILAQTDGDGTVTGGVWVMLEPFELPRYIYQTFTERHEWWDE